MSNSSSAPTGPDASSGDAAAPDVAASDLLDASSLESTLAGAESSGQMSDSEHAQDSSDSVATVGDRLAVEDVLPGTNMEDPNLGAYLTFETIGNDTVISIGANGADSGAAVPIATLEGITDITLEQLLSNNQIIT